MIKRRFFSGIVSTVIALGLSGGVLAYSADALTLEEYRQAVLSGRAYPLQAPANKSILSAAPQSGSASQVAIQPQPSTSGPENQQLEDYYRAVFSASRKPIYYTNQSQPLTQTPATVALSPASTGPGEKLPQTPSGELTAAEARLLELINSARMSEGVLPVESDPKLVEIAHLKARDMLENGYFGHISPTYGSPGQMLRRFGVSFRSAGENLARAGDVYRAHMLILTSTQGHREIMLDPSYNKVGVAVVAQGSSVLVVELFAAL